ncbi:ester cyclase [candidate division KSB1 bacterium]|nr:ester cyclase [candidate division KSB1 bacterium]
MGAAKEICKEYIAAINGKPKTEEMLDKYIVDPDLKEHIRFFESAFPEYELIIDEYIEEDNKVAITGTVRGVHKGELMGIPATGKEISVSLMLIYYYENNKIVKHYMVADNFALMQQLGVIQ